MDGSSRSEERITDQPQDNHQQDNNNAPTCTMLAFALVFDGLSYAVLRTCALVSRQFHKTSKEVFKARYSRNINSYPPSITDGNYEEELCKIFHVPAKPQPQSQQNDNSNNSQDTNNNDATQNNNDHNTDGYVRMWWRGYATSKQYRRMHMDLLNAVKIYGVSAVLIDAYESKIVCINTMMSDLRHSSSHYSTLCGKTTQQYTI